MNTRQLAWWSMAFRQLALVRQWQLEKWALRDWRPTLVERALFDVVSDFWGEVALQDRTRSPDKHRRACPSRERLCHDA